MEFNPALFESDDNRDNRPAGRGESLRDRSGVTPSNYERK